MTLLEFHRHPGRRPYWQMMLLVPLYPLVATARAFVEWADEL